MFGVDDEDGDFLSPSGGAKLASLFGLDQQSSQGNDSFQYTAPKQPRKSVTPGECRRTPLVLTQPGNVDSFLLSTVPAMKPAAPASPAAPAVLFATPAQAFKYINGQYVKQGKLGAAVLGSHATKEYKLLLYLSQQKQVTAARIHPGFLITLQSNNYCTFYDDQRHNWSLMFESEKASSDFCKEVCLAKANSSPSLDTVVVQDLSLGEGKPVETEDSLEVLYTGWLLQNHTLGQMFDSNHNKDKLLRLRLGAGKVIKGWEDGILGMKKSGRRLLVIPPDLAYGAKGVPDRIPPNSTLIFETELKRVKFSKDSRSDISSLSSRDSATPSPAPAVETPEPPLHTGAAGDGRPGETHLLSKSNALAEKLTAPDATKAKLISRMAKMGQPMLPFLTGAGQPESSDSELEDTGGRNKEGPAAPSPMPLSAAAPVSVHAHPLPHTTPTPLPAVGNFAAPGLPGTSHAFQPYLYNPNSVPSNQLQHLSQVYPAHSVSYTGDVTSFLMTEARQHNTEIRLAVGKVADKVDHLTAKIDELQRQGSVSLGMSGMSMETSMIMHNIQRITQENECLKKEVFEKSSRIEDQNRKICELIDQNQRCVTTVLICSVCLHHHSLPGLGQRLNFQWILRTNMYSTVIDIPVKRRTSVCFLDGCCYDVVFTPDARRMEQSNLLLEQRNDTLKVSSEQSQARLLKAEQDKHALPQDSSWGQVHLTDELASATARLSQLQLEAAAHQQKAAELQSKLSSALQESESSSHRSSTLSAEMEELKESAERAQTLCRSEKQQRKQLELKVSSLEEEVQDLKTDKQSLETALSDRKSKWQDERQRRDEELENLRRSHQQELESLRVQLHKSWATTEGAASEQAELEEQWRRKFEQDLASARDRHKREVSELTEQRDTLQEKMTELQEKFTLQEQQSAAVKKELQSRVAELVKQADEKETADTEAEVKRVMNGVFHSLRGEFDLSEMYSGQAVLGVIVTTIKNVTLQLLSGTRESSPKPSEKREVTEDEAEHADEKENQLHTDESEPERKENPVEEEEEEEKKEDAEPLTLPVSETQTRVAVKQEAEPSIDSDAAEARSDPQEAEVTERSEEGAVSVEESLYSVAAAPHDGAAEVTEVKPDNSAESEDPDQKPFGPPAKPPPPPNRVEDQVLGDSTSPAGGTGQENGVETFFQSPAMNSSHAATEEEEEEEELSLKGQPPPTPLFGDDEDDEDLDWLS
ncbi:FK506-binding protein 15 isoform X2 [Synchiropus splendidus]|uniref:FK506-binding protein 15 isoform X2 n=1 Tax=Synchiropus splendidus TaxID=270530 RepID=UPI00237D6876|nr:FK506-binding protein 15 isoform X2 [Synchiropus splendidus]